MRMYFARSKCDGQWSPAFPMGTAFAKGEGGEVGGGGGEVSVEKNAQEMRGSEGCFVFTVGS